MSISQKVKTVRKKIEQNKAIDHKIEQNKAR